MSQSVHLCSLPFTDTSGFPKLPPNASMWMRLRRGIRKLSAMDPNNGKCKGFFRNRSTLIAEQRRHARSPHMFIIHPFSKLATFIEILFYFAWLHSIICNPIMFNNPEKNGAVEHISKFFIMPLKLLLIIIFFFLGYVDRENKQIIISPKSIAAHYLKTYFFFDLIASQIPLKILDLVLDNFHVVTKDPKANALFDLSIVTMEYFCYYVRLGTVLDSLNRIGHVLRIPREIRFVINHVSRAYLIIHLFACLLYTIPQSTYAGTVPKTSWLSQAKLDSERHYILYIYSECLLLATCYFFGASHGMYTISEPIEEVCLSVVTLFGRLYTLFLLADVLRMFGIASVSESRYEQRISQLEEYMSSKKLPQDLRNRLLKYYEYKLQKHYFNEQEILSTLSDHLKTELFLFAARKLIQKASVFKVLPRATLGVIVASMKTETYSPKDVILSIGAKVDDIYFISTGTVAVLNKDNLEMLHLEDGDEFGITLIGNKQRYKHVAVEATEVFYINKVMFLDFVQTHSEGMRNFESTVKNRLAKYQRIEENVRRGGVDLLSELQSGSILEHLLKRPISEA